MPLQMLCSHAFQELSTHRRVTQDRLLQPHIRSLPQSTGQLLILTVLPTLLALQLHELTRVVLEVAGASGRQEHPGNFLTTALHFFIQKIQVLKIT